LAEQIRGVVDVWRVQSVNRKSAIDCEAVHTHSYEKVVLMQASVLEVLRGHVTRNLHNDLFGEMPHFAACDVQ